MDTITVEGKNFKIVQTFSIPRIGWESDNTGYVAEHEGKNYLLLSSYGTFYIAEKFELEAEFVTIQQSLNEINQALWVLN
jgi:hypothetical protein